MVYNNKNTYYSGGIEMRAFVDKEECISCGLCPDICGDIFSMDDDGLAVAKDIEIPEEILDEAQDAEASCPSEAITIE